MYASIDYIQEHKDDDDDVTNRVAHRGPRPFPSHSPLSSCGCIYPPADNNGPLAVQTIFDWWTHRREFTIQESPLTRLAFHSWAVTRLGQFVWTINHVHVCAIRLPLNYYRRLAGAFRIHFVCRFTGSLAEWLAGELCRRKCCKYLHSGYYRASCCWLGE